MAKIDSTPITRTAACEMGTHRCRGTVLSLTDAHGMPCSCPCHGSPVVRDLPATFAELVFAYPPCDGDVELSDDDEAALEAVTELGIERALEDAHFGGGF